MLAGHIYPLTGIRFFAAAWVVLFHFCDIFVRLCPSLEVTRSVAQFGYDAVPFFFLLSGFILAHTYFQDYRPSQHWRFVFLRFAKLWPVHAATVACLVLYTMAVRETHAQIDLSSMQVSELPAELTMIHGWFSKQLVWNYPSWSIHAEWFAYVFVFPLCAYCIRPLRNTGSLCAIVVVALCAESAVLYFHFECRASEIVPLFIAGTALYKLRGLLDWKRGWMIAPAGIGLLGVALAFELTQYSPLVYLAFAAVILGLSFDGGPLNRFLGTPLMEYGGKISFSLYMTHALVQQSYYTIGQMLPLGTRAARISTLVGLIIVILMVASAFYHFVEVPAQAALRKLIKRRSDSI